jgi:osmotically-inducible protein OsmY
MPHPGAFCGVASWSSRRGRVPEPNQRRAAVEVAKSVEGVHDVEDELTLDLRDRWKDDEIRGAALQALMSDAGVPADRLDVRVAEGWLALKGEVKHQCERDAAFEAVSGVPGVGGITNGIKVVTAGLGG